MARGALQRENTNLARRSANPFQDLAVAIVTDTANDYRKTARKLHKEKKEDKKFYYECRIMYLKKLFQSQWFALLSEDANLYILKRLEEECGI